MLNLDSGDNMGSSDSASSASDNLKAGVVAQYVNPQIVEAVQITNSAVVDEKTIKLEGAGKAYQSVANSMAIATQDATDSLRNFSTVAGAALAYATQQLLIATAEDNAPLIAAWTNTIAALQTSMTTAAGIFETIGTDAATILKGFPDGGSASAGFQSTPSMRASRPSSFYSKGEEAPQSPNDEKNEAKSTWWPFKSNKG